MSVGLHDEEAESFQSWTFCLLIVLSINPPIHSNQTSVTDVWLTERGFGWISVKCKMSVSAWFLWFSCRMSGCRSLTETTASWPPNWPTLFALKAWWTIGTSTTWGGKNLLTHEAQHTHVISCYILLCYVISSHILSCHVLFGPIMSCHVLSSLVMLWNITSYHCNADYLQFACDQQHRQPQYNQFWHFYIFTCTFNKAEVDSVFVAVMVAFVEFFLPPPTEVFNIAMMMCLVGPLNNWWDQSCSVTVLNYWSGCGCVMVVTVSGIYLPSHSTLKYFIMTGGVKLLRNLLFCHSGWLEAATRNKTVTPEKSVEESVTLSVGQLSFTINSIEFH